MIARLALVLVVATLAGCGGMQSALDPRGPQAAGILDVFHLFTAVCAAICCKATPGRAGRSSSTRR